MMTLAEWNSFGMLFFTLFFTGILITAFISYLVEKE